VTLLTRSAPAASLPVSRRLARAAAEFLPPMAVALLILPYIIKDGKAFPWEPSTVDLQVYVYAVKDMLAGKDIFATTTPVWNLYFIYPPIAAILMTPLAFGPYLFWQVVWTGGLVWAQQSVLKRCGAPRGWKLGLLGIAVLLAVEPIRTTLGYGQVNTILMALVVADLLPDPPERRRRIPQGILIGLAAAIKLTPALFVIFMFLIGKRRAAITTIISFAVFTGIGAILLFRETVVFFSGLSGGDTRTASPLYAGNQSLLGVFFRLGDSSRTTTLLGLAVATVLAVLGCLVAAHWWRSDEKVFAVAAVLDPPLCVDPSDGDGRALSRSAALGPVRRRLLGGLGMRLSATRGAPVRRWPGTAIRFLATAGGKSWPDAWRDLAGRPCLAAGRVHPCPVGRQPGPLSPCARELTGYSRTRPSG
jgi:alpha-1,2-mannosyltransferase